MKTTIYNELKQFITERLELTEEISENTKLCGLGIDSLDYLEMIMEIEDKFDINITNPHNFITFNDLVLYIENTQNVNH